MIIEKIIFFIICICSIFSFLISLISVNKYNKEFRKQLNLQNEEILSINNSDINSKEEYFESKDSFIIYHSNDDLYL